MHRTTAAAAALALATALATLAACGSTTAHAPTTTAALAATAAPAAFPVTVTAANGSVTVPARPSRILSLSATATEMLYAIGAGSQVVGVDKYSTDPPNAPRTNFDGTEGAESYVPLHPDLVVVAFDSGGKLSSELAALKVPALVLPPATTIDDTYSQFTLLGRVTGHAAEAAQEDATIRQKLDAITASVGTRAKGLTYYHEVDNTLYTATSKTFIGALYARLGMVNVADAADHSGSGYPQLSAEYLVKADPDYVFLADTVCCHESATTFAARPGFSVLAAVKAGHVVGVPDALAAEWGPRVVDFLQDIANAVTK
ncbi:MAG TPA: ABC transporter substrate-binding protein [Acidimicrobiales bacterium]|nr:ABC transporter substrate-binding protein [Acidimicrobiales bacterium]